MDHILSARFEPPLTQFKSDESAYLLYKRVIDKAHPSSLFRTS